MNQRFSKYIFLICLLGLPFLANSFVGTAFRMAGHKVAVAVNQLSLFVGSVSGPGTTQGVGTQAHFSNWLSGLAIDSSGNLYVTVSSENKIFKVDTGGSISAFVGAGTAGFADGTGAAAVFNSPTKMAVETSTGNIFVSDNANKRIRKVTPAGVVTTFIGDGTNSHTLGTGTGARVSSPGSLAFDSAGNLYVGDANTYISKITPAGVMTDFAGNSTWSHLDGTGTAANFRGIAGMVFDASDNLYVSESSGYTIRKVTTAAVVTTIAGIPNSFGSRDGVGSQALFYGPGGMAIDSGGDLIVTDQNNNSVRKVTTAGFTTTIAGDGSDTIKDGPALLAGFKSPFDIAISSAGTIFVVGNETAVRMIGSGSVVSTFVGQNLRPYVGPGFYRPTAGDFDASGNYYAPHSNMISLYSSNGTMSSFAGSFDAGLRDGNGTAAAFYQPSALVYDSTGTIFVSDTNNHAVRRIAPNGDVVTIAGNGTAGFANGTGSAATFNYPSGIVLDPSKNIYVADSSNHVIRKITQAGVVTTVAGAGTAGFANGTGVAAVFNSPNGLAIDSSGTIMYVADKGSNRIRKVTTGGIVTLLAGSGACGANNASGASATFCSPTGLVIDSTNNLFVGDQGNVLVRKVTSAGAATTLAGVAGSFTSDDGFGTAAKFSEVTWLGIDASNNLYVSETFSGSRVRKVTPAGGVTTVLGGGSQYWPSNGINDPNGIGANAYFNTPSGIAAGTAGTLYISDTYDYLLRRVAPDGTTITLAGHPGGGTNNGTAAVAGLGNMNGIGVDSGGNIYIADGGNQKIRKITSAGVVTTFAGSGVAGVVNGTGTGAGFDGPEGLLVTPGGTLFVGDQISFSPIIRKITPAAVVSFLAGQFTGCTNGTGTAANFSGASSIAADASMNLYVADGGCNAIRKVTQAGVVTTFVGSASWTAGSADGTGTAATFNSPRAIVSDGSGNFYVADTGNNLIRKVTAAGVVTTVLGSLGIAGNILGSVPGAFDAPKALAVASGTLYIVTQHGVIHTPAP